MSAKKRKPRIWRDKIDGEWNCGYFNGPLGDLVGWGETPAEAYENWKAKNNK